MTTGEKDTLSGAVIYFYVYLGNQNEGCDIRQTHFRFFLSATFPPDTGYALIVVTLSAFVTISSEILDLLCVHIYCWLLFAIRLGITDNMRIQFPLLLLLLPDTLVVTGLRILQQIPELPI